MEEKTSGSFKVRQQPNFECGIGKTHVDLILRRHSPGLFQRLPFLHSFRVHYTPDFVVFLASVGGLVYEFNGLLDDPLRRNPRPPFDGNRESRSHSVFAFEAVEVVGFRLPVLPRRSKQSAEPAAPSSVVAGKGRADRPFPCRIAPPPSFEFKIFQSRAEGRNTSVSPRQIIALEGFRIPGTFIGIEDRKVTAVLEAPVLFFSTTNLISPQKRLIHQGVVGVAKISCAPFGLAFGL